MRSIMLHAHDDSEFQSRLQTALDLARSFDAHLSIVQAVLLDAALPGDFDGSLATELAPVIRKNAADFRERIEDRLNGEDVRWDWLEMLGPEEAILLQAAPLYDLVVVGANEPFGGKRPSWLAGSLAIHARVPVLAVPRECKGIEVEEPAIVAWNGSAEGARALRAAVPLLKRSRAVSLVTVGQGRAWNDDQQIDIPPVAGADYLARHGIRSEVVELPSSTEKGIAEALHEAARARGAGYLVMGAYGHSRMRETVFGGVTRQMLTEPRIPLFLVN